MPRPLSIALIACLCLALTATAEDKPSPAVKRILDRAVGKVRANRQEFDKANKKPLDEARVELQELVTKLNKDGKTKEAIDTLKQVETLEANVMKMANAPAPVAGGAGPQKPLLERLEGKWSSSGGGWFYRIYANGNAESVDKASKAVTNRGRIALVSIDEVEICWERGERDRWLPAGNDACVVLPKNPAGERGSAFAVERIK